MMTYHTKRTFLFVLLTLLLTGSANAQTHEAEGLKDVYRNYFTIGVAVNQRNVTDPTQMALIKKEFNSITAENDMKSGSLHPKEDVWRWQGADRIANFCRQNGIKLRGHCLVWHSQPPAWMFTYENGDTVSRDDLIGRMYNHIMTVASRYRGRIKGWDVVNEVLNDDGTMRQTPYYTIIGPEYIEMAFRFAHEADPDAELYINDYSLSNPAKREAMCRLVRSLQQKGCRVDAIGMQSHNGFNYPDYTEYEKSIEAFAGLGVKVLITELDINMLPNPNDFSGAEISQKFKFEKALNPYKNGLTKKGQRLFDQRYLDLFKIYERHKDQIGRITFWGLTDRHSWLNDWPVKGRTNYPLLFDRNYAPKPVLNDILKLFE